MSEPFLGILSLDTAFPRIVGDAGNPHSYPCPARVRVVEGADSALIVADAPPPPVLLEAFLAAARDLEAQGAFALVSTCGFLITAQAEIARAVSIPVAVSSLALLPLLQAIYGTGRIGILTASKAKLGPACLRASGADENRIAIVGMEGEEAFRNCFLVSKSAQSGQFDHAAMERAVVARAEALISEDLGAILLECGNLPPYAAAIRAVTGCSVYSVLDLAGMLHTAAFRE